MCGICGFWGTPDPEALSRMLKRMHHRGPDDAGTYVDEHVSLGMTRLSILDLSTAGHQPICTPDKKIWIIYNGEVYNFQSERNLLESQGIKFTSHSDTEVILRLYEKYGDDFLLRLRGMFALAIYDMRPGPGKERMLLARDPLGIKPLLYTTAKNKFIFASELKVLLASGMLKPEIDPISLRILLSLGSVYQPRTILKGVNMLLPAHRLIIENGQERIERYWTFGLHRYPELVRQPYSELVNIVGQSLEESVRLQMISDVPIGAFLSGGVDSSLTVGLMTRIAGNHVKTFSVGFEAPGTFIDETDEAEQTARFLGAEHTKVIVRGCDVRDDIARLITGIDQPSVDGVNSYYVSQAARKNVTVAISGTGGDELFAGYPWFTEMAKFELEQNQIKKSKNTHLQWLNQPFFRKIFLAQNTNQESFLSQYGKSYNIFGSAGAKKIIHTSLHSRANIETPISTDLSFTDELFFASAVERVSSLCLRGYTNNQLLRDIDAMSMSHSLEVRVPFLDTQLVDMALSIPATAKLSKPEDIQNPHLATYKSSGSKKILIDAGKNMGILRNDIDLQPKRGFTFPMNIWLKDELREIMEDTLSINSTHNRGLFSSTEVEQVRQKFLSDEIHWTRPWLLMVIELWCRQTIDSSTFLS